MYTAEERRSMSFRRHDHPFEGRLIAGVRAHFCEIEGCDKLAILEGWVNTGVMLQSRTLCEDHIRLTEGYIAHPEETDKLIQQILSDA